MLNPKGKNDDYEKKLTYTIDVPIAAKINLKEEVYIGNVEKNKLLKTLQELSSNSDKPFNLQAKGEGNKFHIDLPINKNGDSSLFLMLLHIKLFDNQENKQKTPPDEIVSAIKYTLDFGQKISSATQGIEHITLNNSVAGGSLLSKSKKSPKKFNMKELTKKHKTLKRIQTVKQQLKTNNKTLYLRRSKKYQK